jgi:heat shock protein HslJ
VRHLKFIAVICALGLVACGGGEQIGPDPTVEGGWQLVSGRTIEGDIAPLDSHPVTIDFEEGMVGGTAACNGYGGSYTLDGATISFTQMSRTEMACSPQETMELESQFLDALIEVNQAETLEDSLTLSGESVELVFERVPEPPTADLIGTVWVLDRLVQGDAVSSVSGERATLEYFTDGSFLASTGCRGLTGNYTETPSEIQTTDMAASGDCPDDLAAQDSKVITVLEGGYRAAIDGQTLTLGIFGDEGLVYRAES